MVYRFSCILSLEGNMIFQTEGEHKVRCLSEVTADLYLVNF